MNIKIKCPAKINLTLEVLNRRDDGFHNIKSVMQMISLYDYLYIDVEKSLCNEIILSGTSDEIPYNENNLVYKACELFLQKTNLKGNKISVKIEKNIPVAAGLAGGSTDAAGALFGLNTLFNNILNSSEIEELCASLGSDLNVCLKGGCLLATSRGEKTCPLPVSDYPVTLIKPKKLGISAKEAYTKYTEKQRKSRLNTTEKLIDALEKKEDICSLLYNDLEYAVFDDYEELQYIKQKIPSSIMSGSGSTYFVLDNIPISLPENYQVIGGLRFISTGVDVAEI